MMQLNYKDKIHYISNIEDVIMMLKDNNEYELAEYIRNNIETRSDLENIIYRLECEAEELEHEIQELEDDLFSRDKTIERLENEICEMQDSLT